MREGRGKETEEEKGSRGRGGKQCCRGGGRESRQQSTRLKDLGKQRRREAHQAEREVPDGGAGAAADGGAGADSRQSRCCRARSAAWAAGWWTRAEEQPSRKQSSWFARRLLSSSPLARTQGKCLARSISCARSVFGQTRGRFPAPIAFRARQRSFWRPCPTIQSASAQRLSTPNSVRRTPYMLKSSM